MSIAASSAIEDLSLKAAITPSRAACESLARSKSNKKSKKETREKAQDEFKAPAPRNSAEKRAWDRMSTHMNAFHSRFRHEFETIYLASDKIGPNELPQFLLMALQLEQHLHFHHSIEEQHIFPILAQRMPEFRDEHLEEHEAMTIGLHRYAAYLRKCTQDKAAYQPDELKRIMGSFGPVLFYHLDAEVESLRADNLRRYYTLEEVNRLPM